MIINLLALTAFSLAAASYIARDIVGFQIAFCAGLIITAIKYKKP